MTSLESSAKVAAYALQAEHGLDTVDANRALGLFLTRLVRRVHTATTPSCGLANALFRPQEKGMAPSSLTAHR